MAGTHQQMPRESAIKSIAARVGCPVLCAALKLFYAARRNETPAWARGVMIGAVLYLVTPLDAVPDVLPGIGYADDLSVLMAALATVAAYIDDNVKKAAGETAHRMVKTCRCD
ncbi:DUF1232 domain-containing protein [bacterium]|nr:DUF1232 domain-containing protein [bacterium]